MSKRNYLRPDNHGRLKDRATGRFVALPDGVHRIKVGGVTLFLEDEPEEPLPEPTEADREKWGEFA